MGIPRGKKYLPSLPTWIRRSPGLRVAGIALVLWVLHVVTVKKDPLFSSPLVALQPHALIFGEYGSMTGSESTFGVSTHMGILLALEEANQAGGVDGRHISLLVYDDQGRSDEAITAVSKLITLDKAILILGEVASPRSIAGASVAQQFGIPMISPSSTSPLVTQMGDKIFRVCFTDPFQGFVMAKFAFAHLHLRRGALFRDIRSDYSVGLCEVFSDVFRKLGGTIVAEAGYAEGDLDFRAQLRRMMASNPEFIFVPGYYTEVGLIARQAEEVHFKGALLGGDGWDSEQLYAIGGNAIVGHFFANHYSDQDPSGRVRGFIDRYKRRFGQVPSGLAAMGYDAALVALDAVKRAHGNTDPQSLVTALLETRNYPGVTGNISINSNRDADKPAIILRVEKDATYSPAAVIESRELTEFQQQTAPAKGASHSLEGSSQ